MLRLWRLLVTPQPATTSHSSWLAAPTPGRSCPAFRAGRAARARLTTVCTVRSGRDFRARLSGGERPWRWMRTRSCVSPQPLHWPDLPASRVRSVATGKSRVPSWTGSMPSMNVAPSIARSAGRNRPAWVLGRRHAQSRAKLTDSTRTTAPWRPAAIGRWHPLRLTRGTSARSTTSRAVGAIR
jgi:hypothetical protein